VTGSLPASWATSRIRPFEWFLLAVAVCLFSACLLLADKQFFWGDDFPYLAKVRGLPWSWREVFLPRQPGFNWSYRPLAYETFFYVGDRILGLNPFGYLAVSLSVHFASGVLFWLLGLRLGLERSACAFAALLSVMRPPSLEWIFFISIFSYVLAKFWMLASVLLSLIALREERRARRVGLVAASAISTGLALLANEVAIATPAIVAVGLMLDGRLRPQRLAWRRLVSHLAPHVLITTVWGIVRFKLAVLPDQSSMYARDLSVDILWRAEYLIEFVLGSTVPFSVLSLWTLVPWVVAATGRTIRRRVRDWPLHAVAVGFVWLASVEWIFAPFVFPQVRYALLLEVPVCLLVGAGATVAWRCAPLGARPLLACAAALSITVTIPFAALRLNWIAPRGDHAKALLGLVERDPSLYFTKIVLLYGGANMASAQVAGDYTYSIWYGAAFKAFFPNRFLSFEMQDVSKLSAEPLCVRCRFVAVRPNQSLEIVRDPSAP
jgi:hypothetical protein